MRIKYDNIQTVLTEDEVKKGTHYTHNIVIETEGIKAFNLTDDEYTRVMQALTICNHKRFKEEAK